MNCYLARFKNILEGRSGLTLAGIAAAFLLLFSVETFAQGEIDDQEKTFYRNERTFAPLVNSNGYGFNFRYAKRINAYRHQLYELELVEIKHTKEVKTINPYFYTSARYVYGKMNLFYNLRANYGLQKEIYRKFDIGGVAIRRFFSTGVSLGGLKPIYYEILHLPDKLTDERFDPSLHRVGDIMGRSSFFKGITEVTGTIGLNAKFGYNFEYSKVDELIKAVEVGAVVDLFLITPQIMALTTNNPYYLTLYASYRFGKIVDSRQAKTPDLELY